jgi:hypothetical protein
VPASPEADAGSPAAPSTATGSRSTPTPDTVARSLPHSQLSDHRADITPTQRALAPGHGHLTETGGRVYPALVADGYDAGGEGCLICRFHPHTARQMAADLAGQWRADGHDAGGSTRCCSKRPTSATASVSTSTTAAAPTGAATSASAPTGALAHLTH